MCGLVQFLNQEKLIMLKDPHLNVQAVTVVFIHRVMSVLIPSWAYSLKMYHVNILPVISECLSVFVVN
jgi:hypothetical protein